MVSHYPRENLKLFWRLPEESGRPRGGPGADL